jgi:Hypothetical protein (DUF2513).
MKRDMILVKKILECAIANYKGNDHFEITIDSYEPGTLFHYVCMLCDAGFLKGKPVVSGGSHDYSHRILYITWQGYELLESLESGPNS